MKKSVIFILLAVSLILVGCNSSTQGVKPNNNIKIDVTNKEIVKDFIGTVLEPIDDETFNKYIPFYVDLNKDGKMDVAYVTDEWYGNLLFIQSGDSKFELKDSTKSEIHKFTDISVQNNFIIVTGEHVYNGYVDKRTEIYYYSEQELTKVATLINESLSSSPPYNWIGEGTITLLSGYNKFEYSYSEYEENVNNNSKVQIQQKNQLYEFSNDDKCYIISKFGNEFKKDRHITDINTDNDSKPNVDSSLIMLSDIKNGQKIDEFEITDIYHDPRQSTSFTLKGQKWVNATLVYYEDGYEGYYFSMSEKLLTKGIRFGSDIVNFYTTIDSIGGAYMVNEAEVLSELSPMQLKHLKNGNELTLYALIENPTVMVAYESEGCTGVKVLDFEIKNNDIVSTKVKNLEGFENETVNNVSIDYSKYKCVIIPTLDTVNRSSLEFEKLYFLEQHNGGVYCSVMGTLYQVKITYYDSIGDEGITYKYDEVKDTYYIIKAPFNTDMSYVEIQGKVHMGNDVYKEVSVTLDLMRDKSEYKILTIK